MQNSNLRKYIIIAVALILIAVGAYFIFSRIGSGGSVATASGAKSSLTTIIKEETYKESISASGTVYLEDEVSIYASEEGLIIDEFLVEEGDYVEEGQAVIKYDIDDKKEALEKTIKNLETNLANEKLNLESLLLKASDTEKLQLENATIQAEQNLITAQNNLNNYESDLAQKEQAVKDALVSLENAQRTYTQNLALYEVGAVSESDLTTSKNDAEKAQVTYDNTITSLEEFKTTKTSLELAVRSAENSLKQSQINLANADNPLSTDSAKISYQKLLNSIASIEDDLATNKKDLEELPYYAYATTSGIVTSIPVNEGSKTEDNVAMLKISDINNLIIKASISEYDVPSISVGQTVEMTSDGIEDKTYYGTITKINTTASSTNTNLGSETVVGIEISLENGDEQLKAGYTLDLEILVVNEEGTISVSSSSVLTDARTGESYVFVVKDGKVVKTQVVVGSSTSTKVQILSGINFGDEIITKASEEIQDGMTLDKVSELSSSSSSSSSSSFEDLRNNAMQNITGGSSGGDAPSSGGGGRPSF